MDILNRDSILSNASSPLNQKLRTDALDIFKDAIEAVDPEKTIMSKVKLQNEQLTVCTDLYDLTKFKRIFVIGGGKAAVSMARAIESVLGRRITSGLLNVLKGSESDVRLKSIQLNGSAHPIPDDAGVIGVQKMLNLVDKCNEDDLVLVLISGGGSALMPSPADGVSLADIQTITSQLLKRGATINEINAIRKHLDSIKGGQLAERCQPAQVIGLIISDVVGDPLDIIASGPTSPDSSTFLTCQEILNKYLIWENAPLSIKNRFLKGVNGLINETPKPTHSIFKKVKNYILANNSIAADAAAKKATKMGYQTLILSSMIEGEARHVGTVFSGIAREINIRKRPVKPPAAIILGGETTVEVKGNGVGGRNQEVALAASKKIANVNCIIASLATDGIDGPTDSAGAIVDGMTMTRAINAGLNPDTYLSNNSSYEFFNLLNDHILTGPTGTNVNDLALILVAGT